MQTGASLLGFVRARKNGYTVYHFQNEVLVFGFYRNHLDSEIREWLPSVRIEVR